MATRNQAVRNSLLRSSSSIKNIARSVTAFTSGFSTAQKSAEGMSESIEEDNKFKKSLLVTDNSYFRKRQENIRRKDREDELEASTVGGAVKKSGDITQTSTRGFLGRILDFIGVLFIGWMVSTLPALIKGITSFLSKAGNMLNALRNWTGGVTDAYTRSNEELGETEQKLQGIEVQRQDAEAETNQELDATAGAFRSIGQQLSGQMQMFKDPQGFGFSESSWEKVGNINFTDKDKPPEPEKKSFSDRVGDFFWGPDKKTDNTTEDKKEDKKEDISSFASNPANTQSTEQKTDESSKSDKKENIKNVEEEKNPFAMTNEEEEDDGIESRRTDVKVTKDNNGNVTKVIKYEDGTERTIYSPKSGGFEQKTIWPDGTETENSFDMFADGGRPTVGKTSIVGEKGPELFVADKPGTIVPNSFFDKKSIKGFTDKLTENLEIGETNKEVLQAVADELALTGKKAKSIVENIDTSKIKETSREAFDSLGVDPEKIGGLFDSFKSIIPKKIRSENITKTIESGSGRKKPKVIVVPIPSPQPQTQQQSSPSMPSPSGGSKSISVPNSNMVNSFTNKLQELELSYT